MTQDQANQLVIKILANYPYPVDGVKLAAYSAQIVEFDLEDTSEILLQYCRTKPKPDEPPGSFGLRKAIIDAHARKKEEFKALEEPRMGTAEVKRNVSKIMEEIGYKGL